MIDSVNVGPWDRRRAPRAAGLAGKRAHERRLNVHLPKELPNNALHLTRASEERVRPRR